MSASNRLRGLWNMTRFYMAQKKAARAVKKAEQEKANAPDLAHHCAQRGCAFLSPDTPTVCPVCGNPFIEARQ